MSAVLPGHIFVELTSLDELSFPTSSSTRIRYTCLCASPHYLAVGSTSGTVYLFSRYAAKYRKSLSSVPVQVIACKEGAVRAVAASPNEKYLAVATSQGNVSVVSLTGTHPSVALNNQVHAGSGPVTCVCWMDDSSRLYVGDASGKVSVSRITSRNLFRSPSEVVLELDTSIVQMDYHSFSLLVSTVTRSYLFHVNRGTWEQIGRKLRSGAYGGCFLGEGDGRAIFVARPGSRLWEVDANGGVYSTHQFALLDSAPCLPLITFRIENEITFTESPLSAINFETVHVINDEFLMTVNDSRLCVVDPRKASVIIICDITEEILEYSVCGNDVFLLAKANGGLRKLSLFSVKKAVEKLHWRECFLQAARVIALYAPVLSKVSWKPDLIQGVVSRLAAELEGRDGEEKQSLEELMSAVSALLPRARQESTGHALSAATAVRLHGGVHRVLRFMENSGYDDDFTFRAPSPLRPKQRCYSSPTVDFSLYRNKTEPSECTADVHAFQHMSASRSEDSLKKLGKDKNPTSDDACPEEIPVKSVRPSIQFVELKLAEQSLEERMRRSLESSGKRVLNSLEKMSYSLVLEEQTPNTEQADSAPPPPVPPLLPMPDVPTVTQIKRGKKKRYSMGSRSPASRAGRRQDELNNSKLSTSPIVESDSNQNGNLNLLSSSLPQAPADYKEQRRDWLRCPRCGIHMSWLVVFSLVREANFIPVSPDYFRQGGVPSTLTQWLQVLRLHCSSHTDGQLSSQPCSDCLSILGKEQVLKETEKSCGEQTAFRISALAGELSPSRVRRLFPKADGAGGEMVTRLDELAYSTYLNPIYDSAEFSEGESMRETRTADWSWLGRLPRSMLLLAMARVLGPDVALTAVHDHSWLRQSLSDSDWTSLSHLSLASAFPPQIIETIVSDLLGPGKRTSHCSNGYGSFSIAIDTFGYCPFCTLPLNTTVSDAFPEIVAFECGHSCHGACMRNQRFGHESQMATNFECLQCSAILTT